MAALDRITQQQELIGTLDIDAVVHHFTALMRLVPLKTITDEAEYEKAVSMLNKLLDAGGANEHHVLAGLVHWLGGFIEKYESRTEWN
jgi:HTH-type transcriptional regulator / antitoxin HigA